MRRFPHPPVRLVGIVQGFLRHHTPYDETNAGGQRTISIAARHVRTVGCLRTLDESVGGIPPHRQATDGASVDPPLGSAL